MRTHYHAISLKGLKQRCQPFQKKNYYTLTSVFLIKKDYPLAN